VEKKQEEEEVSSQIIEEEEIKAKEEPTPKSEKPSEQESQADEERKPSIKISISGVDDVIASSRTFVTTPNHGQDMHVVKEGEIEVETEVASQETPSEPERIDSEAIVEEISADFEIAKEEEEPLEGEIGEPPQEDLSLEETVGLEPSESIITEIEETSETDAAVIRPIVDAKGLILGEDVVGRASLLSTASFEPVRTEDDANAIPYHFKRIIKLKEHRVSLDIWHFDEAVKAGIQRKEFYDSPDIVLVVYSVVDRWSFESITYWLKEIAVTNEVLPPVVIIGNKIDLRTEQPEDTGDIPVTEEEGFEYAEELATTLAKDGKLHPIAFVETSCVTKEKVLDAFTIAAELFVKHQL
jgi:hypothetical protein